MRTKNKELSMVRVAMLSAALFFTSVLSAQNAARPLPKDNRTIEIDVSTTNAQKAEVDKLRDQVKGDDRSGLKEMAEAHQKELTRAHSELRKDRSFLRSDVRDVSKDNRIAVRNSKRAIRLDKADLSKWRKDLRHAKKQGDAASIRFDEWQVKLWERILDSDRERLQLEKDKRSYDRAFSKKEMKRLQGSGQRAYFAT